MATGGIAYYLSKVKRGKSATQIIEELAFSKQAFLLDEFDNLFDSLFENGEIYAQIVKLIAKKPNGIGKRKLLEEVGKFAVGSGGKKIKRT